MGFIVKLMIVAALVVSCHKTFYHPLPPEALATRTPVPTFSGWPTPSPCPEQTMTTNPNERQFIPEGGCLRPSPTSLNGAR